MKATFTTLLALPFLCLGIGCSSLRTRDNFQPQPIPKSDGIPSSVELFKDASSRWWDAKGKTELAATDAVKRDFLVAGLNLSDELADTWLKGQFRKDTDSRYWKNAFNTTLNLTTAVLGWTGAGAKAVTAVGAGGAAVNSGWNNYEAAYLLSNSMPKVIEKLKAFRKTLRAQIEQDFESKDYSYLETRMLIDQYHDTISRESVKNFIDSSVDLAQASYHQPVPGAVTDPAAATNNVRLYRIIYDQKEGSFDETALAALYLQHVKAPTDPVLAKLEAIPAYKDLLAAAKQRRTTESARLLDLLNGSLGLAAKADALHRKLAAAAPDPKARIEPRTSRIGFHPKIEAIR